VPFTREADARKVNDPGPMDGIRMRLLREEPAESAGSHVWIQTYPMTGPGAWRGMVGSVRGQCCQSRVCEELCLQDAPHWLPCARPPS